MYYSAYFCSSYSMRPIYIKYLLIIAVSAILFVPFLGQAHLFDWDEANFAESAREMLASGNWLRVQIDFQPFWEKPPLFIWMQAVCMGIFGVNEFAGRLPNALIGIATMCTVFYAGKKIIGERMAWWWVLLYAASWLPHFYFKSGIIDPTFNYFIFLAFFQMWLLGNEESGKATHAILAGVFLGLATLTKGPVAILIAVLALVVYVIWQRGLRIFRLKELLLVACSAALCTFLWFGTDIVLNGWWFTREFITYQIRLLTTQDAGHGGPFYYHFLVLLLGCFPASVWLFQSGKKSRLLFEKKSERDFVRWMWILLGVTLILFSIVKTKIVHYSSLCYFPITFLAARFINQVSEKKAIIKPVVLIGLYGIGGLLALAITLLPFMGMNKDKLIPYIDDPFAIANLNADVSWSYAEMAIGLLYLAGLIVALIQISKHFDKGILILMFVQIFVIEASIIHFTPKIEAYSQRSAIEFYQSLKEQDVYLMPLDFKSYAYLFYSEKKATTQEEYYRNRNEWLLRGNVDKPVYFICKNFDAVKYTGNPDLQFLGEKNGYCFFRRK